MERYRTRAFRIRVVLAAVAALLWSQLALAAHFDCPAAPADPASLHAEPDHACDGGPTEPGAVCASHCSQGEASADSVRVQPLPPMVGPAFAHFGITAIASLSEGVSADAAADPPGSWHRPTTHPAALLLL